MSFHFLSKVLGQLLFQFLEPIKKFFNIGNIENSYKDKS